ncbi:malonate decarboxylase holo-ACP synthase [Pseudomonas sp. FW306-02-F02-AA]|uniref:Phosphoribosyl-dephospho-CoA transferase n=1 Tax=Pseudomonas fluorescens TaxID=294 RepID=A0A0N9WNG0_PSEFL|nr:MULTISPECIES: malonate decarboxylase holo-ACP synthase [Pseudomonas]ALI04219.1 phosphoribosyl-dephospho-CoA transferase [Pseudomonas fluorescens]PMZ02422.1 malonate decarboxylase holo-ACP synthase [Pseudomonas sp. FW306-02-F02-AB]PMZ10027.1 malonate decarboxylase holo-ACP synthase [Pseudomonas sp. FW306-02-H06C]PMZ14259.1 malonate decarboxylase holo-ACP synthase [Pseudomonas sp. FW306-02-F02-AA]PMZ20327.1 malonate decarboxylase holo-ACP synthase [Pseudomonas sp. FW306-02-F08-AA]
MVNAFLAHDLLWGLTAEQLPADAPRWAVEVTRKGHPVVVRRAMSAADQIAVGVRGALREQRYATWMAVEAIRQRIRPEDLCHVEGDRDLPALQALVQLRPMLDACGWVWGVSGSAGFELACGVTALHERSDLDLILRTPQPLDRVKARELLTWLDAAACPVDMQLQTPLGAVALREWAGPAQRVLLKNAHEARLVTDPWYPQEQTA